MSETLAAHVADLIKREGPINVAQFMQLCLLHPRWGYYATRQPFGDDGDFITAPEITPMFGEIVGAWLLHRWQQHGSPTPLRLVEIGGGRGLMACDMLRVLANLKLPHNAVTLHMVEPAASQRRVQQETLRNNVAPDMFERITWSDDLDAIPPGYTVLATNEVLDALPVRQWSRTESGWHERMLGLDYTQKPETLAWLDVPCSAPMQNAPDNFIEISEQAKQLCNDICHRLKENGGSALIIDYGSARNSCGWSLQAIAQHRKVDPLTMLGEADLSVHADFSVPIAAAQNFGIECEGPIPMGKFLLDLGLRARAEQLIQRDRTKRQSIEQALWRLTDTEQMGNLFNVIALG